MQQQASASTSVAPLTPVLSSRYALRWQHLVVTLFFATLYLYISYVPLFHALVWRHASVGDWILQHRSLPMVDPSLPLAAGKNWTTTSWLSDVLLASVHHAGGSAALSALLAITFLALAVLMARIAYVLTEHRRFALLAALVVIALHWNRLSILRPELWGLLCLGGLLWMLATLESDLRRWPKWSWFAFPALFVLWANLDGSVVWGTALLVAWAIGRAIDVAVRQRSLRAVATESSVRNSIYLAELCWAATLLQPLGLDLWAYAAQGTASPLWSAYGVWRPLMLWSGAGLSFGLFWLVAGVLLRMSPRPLRTAEVFWMLGGSLAVILHHDLLIWFAPVALFVLLPHLAAVLSGCGAGVRRPLDTPPVGTFAFSLFSALAVWAAFALSPLATPILGGQARKLEQLHNSFTPLAVSQFLREEAPEGLVWAPQEWGDWLQWNGSPGLQLAANSNSAVLTPRVRYDLAQVSQAQGNWTRTLDRYGVTRLVVDKARQPRLYDSALGQGSVWEIQFEDRQALVLKRSEF